MLSDRFYALFALYFKIAPYFGIMPFSWCRKSRTVLPSLRGRKLTRFNTFLILLWCIFTICQLIRFHLLKDREKFNITVLYGIGAFICLEAFSIVVFKEEECIRLFNNILFYMRHMNKVYIPKYDPNNSKLSRMLDCFVLLLVLIGAIIIPLNWILVYKAPNNPNFIGSILPEKCPLFIVILIRYIYPFFCLFIMYINLFTYGAAIFLYGVIVVPFILWEFRLGRRRYFAIDELRRPPLLWNAWRSVQVLQLSVNNLLGCFLVPTQTLFGKIVVYCLFMLIRHQQDIKSSTKFMLILWASLGGLFWCLVLFMGGCIHMYGQKILDSWKYHNWKGLSALDKKIMKKFRKSCRPVSIAFGKTYVIKRLTVLKFIRSLTRGIFRALLTFGIKSH